MRIRSTKPEFWKSRRITSVSWDARLVLKGLESYVDDNGVGIDDIELIVTDVFPRDMFANGRETVARVSEAIAELHQAGLVHRYSSESDDLLYISFWEEVQRIDKPGKGRNPRPDGTLEYKESVIRESFASPPDTLAPGTGEQGNRGTGEQRNRGAVLSAPPARDIEPLFAQAYSRWPKKAERKKSLEKFKQACRKRDPDELVADIIRFGDAYAATTDVQYVPALVVWLNGERWTDALPQPRGPQQQQYTRADQAHDFISRLEAIDAASGGGETTRGHLELGQSQA